MTLALWRGFSIFISISISISISGGRLSDVRPLMRSTFFNELILASCYISEQNVKLSEYFMQDPTRGARPPSF